MSKLHITAVAAAIAFIFSTSVSAQNMTKDQYKAGKEKAESEYKFDKTTCASLAGNAKNICMADAKGKEAVAKAELEDGYKPTPKTHYQVRLAKAEANYAVAKEKCNDKAGNTKDVCGKEASAALTSAKADAQVQEKTTDAMTKATEKTSEAHSDADKTVHDARQEAATDKTDAAYSVAKEKCSTFADTAKDRCLDDAKARFGKQ